MTQTTDARELATGLERLAGWLRRQIPPQLSTSTMTALDRLSREGPLRVSDLARREAMTQPGVTVLVNRLAESGFAERVADPTDGRASLVCITPAGQDMLDERRGLRTRVLEGHLDELAAGDRALLLAALPAIERLVATGDGRNSTTSVTAS